MQTSSSNQIEPALRGTRYGQALEAAAQAAQTRRIREAEDQAAWEAAHPECRANRIINMPPQPSPLNPQTHEFDNRQAYKWAAALTALSDGEWHPLPASSRLTRVKLKDMKWAEARGHTSKRSFRITTLGDNWLHNYRAYRAGKHV